MIWLYCILSLIPLFLVYYELKTRKRTRQFHLTTGEANKPSIIPSKNATIDLFKGLYEMFLGNGGVRSKGIHNTCMNLIKKDFGGSLKVRLVQSHMMGFHFINVWDADFTREILFSKDEVIGKENFGQEITKRLIGDSIISVEGDEWKRQKKILSPAFGYEHLKCIVPEINTVGEKFVDVLSKLTDKPISIYPLAQKATLEVIGKSGFGVDFDALEESKVSRAKEYEELMKDLQNPIHFFDKLDSLLGSRKKLYRRFDNFDKFINEIIDKKRKIIAENRENYQAKDILDSLILAHDSEDGLLTDNQLRSNLNTFFIAGHETTSATISSAIHFLALNQEIQDRAFDEIQNTVGRNPPTYDQLKDLNYLHNCIKETLRLFPPAPLIIRKAKKEMIIGGYYIPENTTLAMYPYTMQRDPQYWENPEQFDPDRFSDEKKDQRHRYAYIPFSIGPRQCIGNNLATIEMKILLVYILQNFQIIPDPKSVEEFVPFFDIVTHPPPKCTLIFKPRKY